MNKVAIGVAIGLLWLAASSLVLADNAAETALRNAENAWSQAFVSGDSATLDALLEPNYVSVGASGVAHDKQAVIAASQHYAAAHAGAHADPMPPSSTITVRGSTAIVRHTGATDVSVDVFYCDHGHWRALYSQHTTPAAPPQ